MIGIYKITNQINGKSYIGKSIHIQQRWREHLYNNSKCSLLKYALQKYGINNFKFEVIEECSQEELTEREIYWIQYYNTFNDGYNLTLGGEGVVKYNMDAVYEDYNFTQSIKQTAKNFKCHENTVRNILREYGVDKTELQLAKPIECLDPRTLKVIKKFSSIQEAADEMKVQRNAIRLALIGEHKSSAGYYWRYIGDNTQFEIDKTIKPWKVKVQKINYYTDEVIEEFESISDAAESVGKDRKNGGSSISSVCNGKRKSAFGYKWKKIVTDLNVAD